MFEFLSDLWAFAWERKKWWLLPVILFFVLLGAMLMTASNPALMPVLYPLF